MKKVEIELKDEWVKVKIPPGIKTLSEIIVRMDLPDNHYQFELGEIHLMIDENAPSEKLVLKENNCINKQQYFQYSFDDTFDITRNRSIEFRHMKIPRDYLGSCKVYFVLSEVKPIQINNPLLKFEEHITQYENSKIVFSAPFGEGKSTFLNYFFERHLDKYEVFKVFPVNYSVATNEDIFKYIKTDILFQLLGKDVEFSKTAISITEAFQEYIYLHPKKVIFSFLKNIAHLNSQTKPLAEALAALNKIMEPIFKYHANENIDEKLLVHNYIEEIYAKEGSLFEDNFYSQLIREQLGQFDIKETVLIIEDLDRMDPEHVFRILNVISAHNDENNSDVSFDSNNKFGFDKIIVVCDVNNIQAIFEHRYGDKVDFNGYFNKFFSTKPFLYENKSTLHFFLKNYYIPENQERINKTFDALVFLMEQLVNHDMISLRELIKITSNEFVKFQKIANSEFNNIRDYYEFRKNVFAMPLLYLNKYYRNDLKSKFRDLKSINNSSDASFNFWSRQLLAGLAKDETEERGIYTYKYNETLYTIQKSQDYFFDYWKLDRLNDNQQSESFTKTDFYDLLIEVYDEMKGL